MGEFPSKKNQFKKGQSGNPNGRPPKVMKQVFKELDAEGFERVPAEEIYEAFERLLGLSSVLHPICKAGLQSLLNP